MRENAPLWESGVLGLGFLQVKNHVCKSHVIACVVCTPLLPQNAFPLSPQGTSRKTSHARKRLSPSST